MRPKHSFTTYLLILFLAGQGLLNAQTINRIKISDLQSNDTISKYDLQVQNFIRTENETEFDSYILITSGRAFENISTPRLSHIPTDSSDLQNEIRLFEADSLVIGYNHPDTTFLIDYTMYLQSSCGIKKRFTYEFINEAPVILDQDIEIDENIEAGSSIGFISADDPDEDDLIFSTLSSSQPDLIELDSNGEILLKEGQTLDFEQIESINLKVEVDDGWITDTAFVNIKVNNLNEEPFGTNSYNLQIEENPDNGNTVLSFDLQDPDGDQLTYSIISSSPEEVFKIDDNELIINDSSLIDFEVREYLSTEILSTDGEYEITMEASFTISNINEAPFIDSYQFEVDDTVSTGKLVGVLKAEDPEDDEISYSIISGNSNNQFEIDQSTGEITIASDIGQLSDDRIFNLTIEANDGELSSQSEVTVTIIRIIVASIDNDPLPGIKVFPNPVRSQLIIDLPKEMAHTTDIFFRNIEGKILSHHKGTDVLDNSIDVSHLPNGVYLIQFRNGLKEKTVKIRKIE